MVSPYELSYQEDLNQEQEEEELHRRLNRKEEEARDNFAMDQNDFFEHLKQKQTLNRWQTNA